MKFPEFVVEASVLLIGPIVALPPMTSACTVAHMVLAGKKRERHICMYEQWDFRLTGSLTPPLIALGEAAAFAAVACAFRHPVTQPEPQRAVEYFSVGALSGRAQVPVDSVVGDTKFNLQRGPIAWVVAGQNFRGRWWREELVRVKVRWFGNGEEGMEGFAGWVS